MVAASTRSGRYRGIHVDPDQEWIEFSYQETGEDPPHRDDTVVLRRERFMSTRKTHHVVPAPKGGWDVKKGGASKASKHFPTKQDAVNWGRSVSKTQGSEFYVHRKDGTIAQKASHAR